MLVTESGTATEESAFWFIKERVPITVTRSPTYAETTSAGTSLYSKTPLGQAFLTVPSVSKNLVMPEPGQMQSLP